MFKRIAPPVFWIALVAVVFLLGYRVFDAMQPEETALGPATTVATLKVAPSAPARIAQARITEPRTAQARAPQPSAPQVRAAPAKTQASAVRPSQTVALAPPGGVVSSASWTPATNFTYDGHWEHVTGRYDGRTNGSSSRSFQPGSHAVLTFNGRFVRLYGIVGPGGGLGSVDIDGRVKRLVDFYAATKSVHKLVFASPPLAAGTHHLTLSVVFDQALPVSRSHYVNIDGAETN